MTIDVTQSAREHADPIACSRRGSVVVPLEGKAMDERSAAGELGGVRTLASSESRSATGLVILCGDIRAGGCPKLVCHQPKFSR